MGLKIETKDREWTGVTLEFAIGGNTITALF